MSTHEEKIKAKELAGNWRKFNSFAWNRKYDLDDPDDWMIFYTRNRDSGLLTESNHAAIEKMFKPFFDRSSPYIMDEHHNHWACGWIEGYAIKCHDRFGQPSKPFLKYLEIQESLDNYPVLDERDYYLREFEATIENIEDLIRYMTISDIDDLPEDAAYQIYDFLSDNDSNEVESRDDQGGYPSEEAILSACAALGWKVREYEKAS